MTDYTAEQVREIAAISEDQHIAVLTNCGIAPYQARNLISASVDMLIEGVKLGEAKAAKYAGTEREVFAVTLLNAVRRELAIRNV